MTASKSEVLKYMVGEREIPPSLSPLSLHHTLSLSWQVGREREVNRDRERERGV